MGSNEQGGPPRGSARKTSTRARSSRSTGLESRATQALRSLARESRRSMSSPEDSLAKTSATPASEPASPASARVFGRTSQGSSVSLSHVMWLRRTSQQLGQEDSKSYYRILPTSGMTRSGTIYQLRPLVRRTSVGAGGWWHTPKAAGSGGGGDLLMQVKMFPTPVARDGGTVSPGDNNRNTPPLRAVVMWPTPTASDGVRGGAQDGSKRRAGGHSENLNDRVFTHEGSGTLNPAWVEWLMGFPIGWTDLSA